jgi:hypothetical protein
LPKSTRPGSAHQVSRAVRQTDGERGRVLRDGASPTVDDEFGSAALYAEERVEFFRDGARDLSVGRVNPSGLRRAAEEDCEGREARLVAHALFGVYGMLGIGLMLFCLRALRQGREWKEWPLKYSFWAVNGGLALMVLLSMLPVGLLQTWAAIEHGTWFARSSEFLQTGLMSNLRWMRAFGDSIFAAGALLLGYFVLGLVTGTSYTKREPARVGEPEFAPRLGEIHATAAD